jgi:membrane protein DedA with SNARE-associated domain
MGAAATGVLTAGAKAGTAAGGGAGAGVLGGIGAAAGIALLLPVEAGIPLPVPADLVMLAVGARVSAGGIPLAVAVLAFEAVAVLGTTALFCVARGTGRAVLTRLGPRIGLTAARLARASGLIERRGRAALALGRATPGLRTITVVAAGGSGLSARRALPALIAGSSLFLQLHLFLGYFLGSAALRVLHAATLPALAALALAVMGGIGFWFTRRRGRLAAAGAAEAACPLCLALACLAERPPATRSLIRDSTEPAEPAPGVSPA